MQGCPFDHETALSDLTETEISKELAKAVRHFRTTLTPKQARLFREIDDMQITQTTQVQHATVKAVRCPSCRLSVRNENCPPLQ